ncbi:hypothetical protein [Brevundimonas sp. Root1423]|uniref:hypothetical protein n=1 Tax=Brevundimonas sp. Root1423 TaxID=1736462 RepID=UPI0006F7FBA2|nr:hypothetical protein [Brevundimonas sp. Root1423]KQY84811.1 hypothetical protein ASD25_07275 [Brevundimonas sp. Root1423]
MKLRNLGLGVLTAVAATVGLGVATATAHVEYTWVWNQQQYLGIAYSYTYYADAGKTEVLGTAYDTCTISYDEWYAGHASHPYIPTPYYDEVTIHHCGGMGPELLPDFTYGT